MAVAGKVDDPALLQAIRSEVRVEGLDPRPAALGKAQSVVADAAPAA